MSSMTALAPKPDKRKGAPTTARPLTISNNCTTTDSATFLRLQRLSPLGLSKNRARLIAGMAWGEVAHG
jgi:hypothetical protein